MLKSLSIGLLALATTSAATSNPVPASIFVTNPHKVSAGDADMDVTVTGDIQWQVASTYKTLLTVSVVQFFTKDKGRKLYYPMFTCSQPVDVSDTTGVKYISCTLNCVPPHVSGETKVHHINYSVCVAGQSLDPEIRVSGDKGGLGMTTGTLGTCTTDIPKPTCP